MLKPGSLGDYDKGSYVEAPSNPTTPARQVVITNDASSPIPVDIQDASVTVIESVPDTAHVQDTISVGNVVTQLDATPLANRKFMIISNETGGDIFYGASSVAVNLGARLNNRQSASLAIGPSISIYAIKNGGAGNVIVQQFS